MTLLHVIYDLSPRQSKVLAMPMSMTKKLTYYVTLIQHYALKHIILAAWYK